MYICYNCMPSGTRLPREWEQDGFLIQVHEVPCSGKTDAQYLFHAFEGGAHGVCVVACPRGECRLAQGNYRAEVRVRMVQRLMEEIGIDPQRIALVHCSKDDPAGRLERLAREAVEKFAALAKTAAAT
jgi:coenzyme F420-reducing hydrogenase delta subunit